MTKPSRTSYTFYVRGMHCNACVLLTESELGDIPYVTSARAILSAGTVEIEGDFGSRSPHEIAADLSTLLEPHGYSISAEQPSNRARWAEFKYAAPIALGFAALFVILQKAGIVSLVHASSMSYGTAFLIGIIASLSSCMAVVGGLVLSMSATFAKKGERLRPQLMFHGGRIASFFALGGVIGAIGSAFALSPAAAFILSLAIGIVMLILGVNLLDVFPWAKRLQPSMPRSISRRAMAASRLGTSFMPLIVGAATFFLPCGFTQSMQLYALTTGSFAAGAMTMLAFALGTLPVLALVSMSSLSVGNSPKAGIFFKTAGLIVIMFALFNLLSSFAAIGIIPPLFNI